MGKTPKKRNKKTQKNLKGQKPFFLIKKQCKVIAKFHTLSKDKGQNFCKSGKKLSHFHTITGIVENKFTHNPTLPTTTNKKKLKNIENLFDKVKNINYNTNVLKNN